MSATPFNQPMALRQGDSESCRDSRNVRVLPQAGDPHRRRNALYSSRTIYSDPATVRKWLQTRAYREQFEFSMKHLNRIAKELSK